MKRLFNSQIKMIKSLQSKKGRKETGLFVAEGIKAVSVLLESGMKVESVVFDRSFDEKIRDQIIGKISGIDVYGHDIESVSSMISSEGILAIAGIPEIKSGERFFTNKKNLLGLFSVSDPGNLGTLIRTAKWFSLDGIILYGDCADIFSPKVIRSSMGAVFLTDFIKFDNYGQSRAFIEEFHKISTYVHKKSNYDSSEKKVKILFLGNEARGIDISLENEFDSNYRIEPDGGFESLNVSVAGGIIMHDVFNSGGKIKC